MRDDLAAASILLEEAARERGLAVRRLDPETLICGEGAHRALFHGLTGDATSRLAQVLCGNDAWLRGHLARHGLPVVPTRLVGAGDARFAEAAARELGFPVRVRLAGQPDPASPIASDAASFHDCWRALTSCEPTARVILEHAPSPPAVVVVAGDTALALGGGETTGAAHTSLAVRATAVLGAGWAVVRLAGSRSPLIDTVTFAVPALAALPARDASRIAGAVLGLAMGWSAGPEPGG